MMKNEIQTEKRGAVFVHDKRRCRLFVGNLTLNPRLSPATVTLSKFALFHLFAPYDLLVFELRAKRCQCKAMPLLCLVNVIYNLLAALLHLFPADLNLFAPHEHGLIALCYQNG